MPGKQSILSIERYRPNSPFDAVIIDLDATVSQEDAEAVPVFGGIGERFTKRRLASDAGAVMRQLGPHVCDQRCGSLLPPCKTGFGVKTAQLGFDPIEFTDPLQAFLSNRC